MSLARASMRGGVVTLVGQWFRYGLQLASIVVLSRLLAPADFGLVAMVGAVVALGLVISEFGLTAAIQRDELAGEQQTTLFYLSAVLGLTVAAVIAAGSGALADFYNNPEVGPVALTLSVVPLAYALSSQFVVELTRSLRFTALAASEVISMGLAVVAAIVLGALGAGVWALVFLQVVQALARLFVVAICSDFRPGQRAQTHTIMPILRFGRNALAVTLLDFGGRNMDNILIGRAWGASTLGFYARAYQLMMLPLQQINAPLGRVALPVLSQLRHEPARYSLYLSTATTALSYMSCMLLGGAVLFAPEIVSVALGGQWASSVDIFRALAAAGVFQAVGYVSYWIFTSLDRTDVLLRYALVSQPLIILAFVIGLPWKAMGVAIAYSAVTVITVPLGIWMACRGTFVSARALVRRVMRPSALAVGATVALLLLREDVHGATKWAGVCGVFLAGAAVLGAVPSYRRDLVTLRNAATLLRAKRPTGSLVDPLAPSDTERVT
jgi:PST family polysaccharide transporter